VLALFAAAFAGYKINPFAAAVVLPSDLGTFSIMVVRYILKVNIVVSVDLLILQYASFRIGLGLRRSSAGTAPIAA
jgi:hypothetical protein